MKKKKEPIFTFDVLDDYHGSWDGKTGHNSPLYAMRNERKKFREWNINSSMHVWVELGCPKEKLNIGLSAYGSFLVSIQFSTMKYLFRTSFFIIWRNWHGEWETSSEEKIINWSKSKCC